MYPAHRKQKLGIPMYHDLFKSQIEDDLLLTFCNHPSRRYGTEGFKENFHEVGIIDAKNFLEAMNADLVLLDEKGKLYKAPRTYAGEQLFWEFDKDVIPRKVSISVEVVITIASLAVLHFEFGWPKNNLGTQSLEPHDGALDLMAYIDGHYPYGYIACEIKKDFNKTDKLIRDMHELGASLPNLGLKGSREKVNKKIAALRHWKPPIFWALGPDGYGSVFRMSYTDDGRMSFREVSREELRFPVALSTSS